MNPRRWILLALVTVFCVALARAGLPARLPLLPARNLSARIKSAALIRRPAALFARLSRTQLLAGICAEPPPEKAGLSTDAANAGLPPLEPPLRIPPDQQAQLARLLNLARPEAAALIELETADATEVWVGLQGGRVMLGQIAGWFSKQVVTGNALWVRLSHRPSIPGPAAIASEPWDWTRSSACDLALVLPRGLPAELRTGIAPPVRQNIADLCEATGLPQSCDRVECELSFDGNELRWSGSYRGDPSLPGAPAIPPAQAVFPTPDQPATWLTLQADIRWTLLYRRMVEHMTEEERADFRRSMRYYRMAEKGIADPEDDMIEPLGRGLALLGLRGNASANMDLMPQVRAEIPLRPPAPSLLNLVTPSPNLIFRQRMPLFAEAKFDKIRMVGQSSYDVHPSYVAVTLGTDYDRYVLIRPSIAGSALLLSWQVDETRIKAGTRPEALDWPDLLQLAPLPTAAIHATLPTRPPPAISLTFDPTGITDQLDKFRILLQVEGGAERDKPDNGVTVERIQAENARAIKRTAASQVLGSKAGWVLERIGAVRLEITPQPPVVTAGPAAAATAQFQGSVHLKSQ